MLSRLKVHQFGSILLQRRVTSNPITNNHFKTMSSKPRNVEIQSDDCLPDYEYVYRQDLLKDKVAFITGGGSGIGFRIAEILMRHGCNTAIASRRLDKVTESAKKLEKATGMKCYALSSDVRNPEAVENTVDKIIERFDRLDILVNCAAGNFLCDIENLSYNAYKTVMEIDTMGTFNCSKAVFHKYFKENGGNIINISATLGYRGDAMQVHAGTAKAAIDAMTRHMAVEWGSNGVRVNGIAPGPIGGTVGMRKLGGESDMFQQIIQGIPLQRMGQKCEIADVTMFLASNAAAYITGAVLVVDGGNWMTSMNNFSLMKQVLMKSKL